MSCVLRVSGESLDPLALRTIVGLKPDRIWQKGTPRSKSNLDRRLFENSGASYVVSHAGLRDFDQQILDAIDFLKRHHSCLEALRSLPGLDDFTLDFGIELRETVPHSDFLTHEFLQAVADTGLSLLLSHYPVSRGPEIESDSDGPTTQSK